MGHLLELFMLLTRQLKWKEWPQLVVHLLDSPDMSFLHIAHSSPVSISVADIFEVRVLCYMRRLIFVSRIRTNERIIIVRKYWTNYFVR